MQKAPVDMKTATTSICLLTSEIEIVVHRYRYQLPRELAVICGTEHT